VIPVEFLTERFTELLLRIREHLFLSGVATGVAVLFGVPLGIYIISRVWLRSFIFALAGIVQTVPSLAMLAFLLALTGKIGVVPAIIALTLYAFLPIIQNTVTGLEGVAPEVVEAARGMGMTPWEEMYLVKLPLARPVIIAGIKTAAIISVGIATLSAFIGAGGLGEFINRGLSLVDTRLILLGAIPSALLALYVSFAISSLEWGLNKRRRKDHRLLGGRSGLVLSLVPLGILFVIGGTGTAWEALPKHDRTIRVGSKNFTEQLILSEMIAQRIEAATDIEVERKLNLGGTMVCHSALLEGEIDIYPEYTGTALTAILKYEDRPGGPEEVFDTVARDYLDRFDLMWLKPFGFNNTYALAIKQEKGNSTGWKKISDMGASASGIRAGFTAEFAERPDGYPGLSDAYGFEFGDVRDLDPSLMYDALRKDEVDLIVAFSTDSRIPGYNLMLLEDDRSFFPPYHAAPLIRQEILKAFPEIARALAPLAGLIDDKTMQLLNYEADQEKRNVKEVVREFLLREGLLQPE
jgi:osmoprotectant transport system permease protein